MSHRTGQSVSRPPARRHERRDGSDIADIYEARLLAHGLRSDDFVALRSSTDVPHLPDITPIRFGRGAARVLLLPIAEAVDEPVPPTVTRAESDDASPIDGEPESPSAN